MSQVILTKQQIEQIKTEIAEILDKLEGDTPLDSAPTVIGIEKASADLLALVIMKINEFRD